MILQTLIVLLCVFQWLLLILQPEFVYMPLVFGWVLPAVIASVALLSFWVTGKLCLNWLFGYLKMPLFHSCAVVTGGTLFGYAFYFLSVIHSLQVPILLTLLILPSLVWIATHYRILWRTVFRCWNFDFKISISECLIAIAVLVAAFFLLLACRHPVTWYDALIYHLSIPQKLLQAGGLIDIPGNVYFHLTLIPQFMNGFLLAFGYESSIHYLIFFVYLVLGIEIGGVLKKSSKNSISSLLYLFLFLAHGEIYMQIMRTGVDVWGVVTVTVIFMFLLKQEHFDFQSIIFVSFMFALLTGIKVNLMIYFFPPVLLYALWRIERSRRLSSVLMMVGMSFLAYMPFAIKNYVFTGNPLFPYVDLPFLNSVWSDVQYDFFRNYHLGRASVMGGIESWLLYPGHIFFLVALWHPNRRVLMIPILSLLIWSFSSPGSLRFIWVLDPALLYLSIDFLTNDKATIKFRRVVMFVFTLFGISLLSLSILKNHDYFLMNLGVKTFEEYKNQMPDAYFRSVRFINENLDEVANILMISEARTYGIFKKHCFASLFDKNVLEDILLRCDSVEELQRSLVKQGFSHVFFNENEWYRLNTSYANFFRSGRTGFFINHREKLELLDSFIQWLKENCKKNDFRESGCFVVELTRQTL